MAFQPISAPDLQAWFNGYYPVYAQSPLPSEVMAGEKPVSWLENPEAVAAWAKTPGYDSYKAAVQQWLLQNADRLGYEGRRTLAQEKEFERAMKSISTIGTALRGVHGDPEQPSVYSWWDEFDNPTWTRSGWAGNPLVRQMAQQGWTSQLPGVIRMIAPELTQEKTAFPGAKPLAEYLAGIGYRLGERKA